MSSFTSSFSAKAIMVMNRSIFLSLNLETSWGWFIHIMYFFYFINLKKYLQDGAETKPLERDPSHYSSGV